MIFLDTEAHFPETLAFVETVRERYDLNLTVTKPGPEAAAHPCGSEQCCQFRKVAPLRRPWPGNGRLADRAEARRRPDPGRRPDRELGRRLRAGQGQPPGHLDRRRHHDRTWPTTSCRCTRCVPGATGPSAARRPRARWPKARTHGPAAGPVLDKIRVRPARLDVPRDLDNPYGMRVPGRASVA